MIRLAQRDGLRGLAQARRYSSAATLFTKLARWLISRDEWLDAALASLDRLRLLDDAGLPFSPLVFQTRAGEFIRAVRDEAEDAQGLAVLDFVDARGLRFDVVFIPGCVESMIPSPVRQDPFLLDDERAAFNAALGRAAALPVRADRAREELRLFDLAGRAATRALYLTYPRLDAQEGRARLPSHLLLALAERVTGRALTFDDLPRQAPLVRVFPAGRFAPDEPELALDEDELDLALMERLASSEETGPVRYLQHARPTTFPRVWAKWVHRWARDELGEHDGLCDSDPARAALRAFLAGDKAWAVSDIEDYLLCPRRYLLGKLLNLSSPDDPEQIVSLPSDKRGSLLHKALAAHLDPRRRSEIEAAVRDEYARLAQENLTGGGVLDEVEVERLVESARALVAVTAPEAERRVVEATEFDQTATIVDDGRPVTLSGRLDRVDRGPGGDRFVIDYKTGKAKSALTGGKLNDDDFNGGATLQIPLYLLAYAAAHAEMSLEALSAAYWYLNREQNRPDPRAVNIGGAFMKEKAGILRRVLRDAVEGIEGGRFAPRPDVASAAGNKYCASCGFTVICDPRARALLGIRGRRAGCCPWVDLVGRIDE